MARNKPRRTASTFGVSESLTVSDVTADEASEAPVAATPPATAPVAAPAPEPEVTPRPAPTRKSTVTRSAATRSAAQERGVAALEGQHPRGGGGAPPAAAHPDAREVVADYAGPAWHPRMKDPTAATSTDLIDEMVAVQAEWTAANRSRLSERNQPPPTNSGFREALLRAGLKHINDPEFIELIPPDARRKQRR